MGQYRELPYGRSDFEKVRKDDMYLVDKTRFLPMLEFQAPKLWAPPGRKALTRQTVTTPANVQKFSPKAPGFTA